MVKWVKCIRCDKSMSMESVHDFARKTMNQVHVCVDCISKAMMRS